MSDPNFSVNATGNLAQYNLVTNKEDTKDDITADDIKVMIKLGQFNKVRGLIDYLEKSSPNDKAAAQKIAAFAEFYKKEINSDLVYENAISSNGNDKDVIIDARLYEYLVKEHIAKGDSTIDIEQYNVSNGLISTDYGQLRNEYINNVLDNKLVYKEGLKDDVVDGRTITSRDLEKLLDNGEQEKIYSLIQFLEQNGGFRDFKGSFDAQNFVNGRWIDASQRMRNYVVAYAGYREHERQFKKNPGWVNPKDLTSYQLRFHRDPRFDNQIDNPYELPVAELPASGRAEELAKFFESKGDVETANRIREEIKKVSNSRYKALAGLNEAGDLRRRDLKKSIVPSLGTDGQPERFDLESMVGSELWNTLDEDLQKRILDLISKQKTAGDIILEKRPPRNKFLQ
jgi:hypothetical protein